MWNLAKTCPICGEPMGYKYRYDAKFCSDACRQSGHRRKQQMGKNAAKAIEAIAFIRRHMTDDDLTAVGNAELKRIAAALNVTPATVTDIDSSSQDG